MSIRLSPLFDKYMLLNLHGANQPMSNNKNKTSKPSYRYAIVSISIVLYFLGMYLLLYMHSDKINDTIKQQVNIVVELKDSVSQQSKLSVESKLSQMDGVMPKSVEYHDRQDAYDIMGSQLSDIESSEESLFSDMYTFRLYSSYYKDDYLDSIDGVISKYEGVHDIFYESDSDVGIGSFIRKISLLFLVLSMIFTALALIIIHNTLNLSLYADRWEIKTMELVGARRAFIRGPYVAQGRIIGQRAFFIAALGIIVTILVSAGLISMVYQLVFWPYLILVLILLFLLSTLITMISTFTVVNKFLDAQLGDLYK